MYRHLNLSDGLFDHILFGPLLASPRVLIDLDGAEEGQAEHGRGRRVHARVRALAAPLRDKPANLLSLSHTAARMTLSRSHTKFGLGRIR